MGTGISSEAPAPGILLARNVNCCHSRIKAKPISFGISQKKKKKNGKSYLKTQKTKERVISFIYKISWFGDCDLRAKNTGTAAVFAMCTY